jgi:hypothetical protein
MVAKRAIITCFILEGNSNVIYSTENEKLWLLVDELGCLPITLELLLMHHVQTSNSTTIFPFRT